MHASYSIWEVYKTDCTDDILSHSNDISYSSLFGQIPANFERHSSLWYSRSITPWNAIPIPFVTL